MDQIGTPPTVRHTSPSGHGRSWRQRWLFLRRYIAAPNTIGSVTPSSRWLVRSMLDAALPPTARVVAEFGPGTGVFTEGIIRRLPADGRLLVFEIDPLLSAALRARITDERVEILTVSAADLPAHLAERGLQAVDCVISGLPFGAFPVALSREILTATRSVMHEHSTFATFQYTPFKLSLFRSMFPTVQIPAIEWRNVPPAAIVVCGTGARRGARGIKSMESE